MYKSKPFIKNSSKNNSAVKSDLTKRKLILSDSISILKIVDLPTLLELVK
jgi:hypothetical protein